MTALKTCTRCRQPRPATEIILSAAKESRSTSSWNPPEYGVLGVHPGYGGAGTPEFGWHAGHYSIQTRQVLVCRLADGTQRDEDVNLHPVWLDGNGVCRSCRTAAARAAKRFEYAESEQTKALAELQREVHAIRASEPKPPPKFYPFDFSAIAAFMFLIFTGIVGGLVGWGAMMIAWYDERTELIDGPFGTAEQPYVFLMLGAAVLPSVLTLTGKVVGEARSVIGARRHYRSSHHAWRQRQAPAMERCTSSIEQAEARLQRIRDQRAAWYSEISLAGEP